MKPVTKLSILIWILLAPPTHAASGAVVCRGEFGNRPIEMHSEFASPARLRGHASDPELGQFEYLAIVEGNSIRLQIKSETSSTLLLDKKRLLKSASTSIRLSKTTTASMSCSETH